ncbi:MAG: hypothetical protein EBV86_01960 [Marivivens sp.]|nr:hypothetical protein [Marivivens sp.]NCW67321.1 hypothetical protein [Marivivens sp.]
MAGILHENVLRGATLLTDQSITNFGFANATDGRTATQAGYAPSSQEIRVDLGSGKAVDTLCIARHTLFSQTCTIDIDGSNDNSTYFNVADLTPTSDDVIYHTFTQATYRYYKIVISSIDANVYFSDFALGTRVDLERDQKHGFIKPEFADGDKVIANITRGQNLAGLNLQEGLKRCRFDLFYYTASFFTTNWANIVADMKLYPVYISWDTNDTEQAFYCWPTSRIAEPRYSKNINGYYDARLDMTGITQ